ncbi:MAG: EAL domain-containing protein [Actinobacteria bacterium]|nr:EAL domain-containing protein [Actinomycetota bacterium]MBW3651112.1 EAL domain-containing protein [Actinomycetota bacterium]
MFRIQRSITRRTPIAEVLQTVTEAAAELLGDEVLVVAIDEAGGTAGTVGSWSLGSRQLLTEAGREGPIHQGVGAMAAPVFQDGQAIAALVAESRDPHRRYSQTEQDIFLALAEHASLAMNAAGAVETMRRSVDEALHSARHDSLTGLPNRTLVLELLTEALLRRDRGRRIGVLLVDLDRFKMVNDTLGHSIGDEVLIRMGERLRAAVRPQDTIGRLAGDEFVVICENAEVPELLRVAERVAEEVAVPLPLYGRDAVITASVGLAHSCGGTRAEDLLRDADVAMYRAKERGRSRIELFDRSFRQRLLQRLETELSLRRALTRDGFVLHYQPILATGSGRLLGFEALVRWEDPERGLVPPSDFIPLAEETGLIIPIGRWVLREACRQLGRWRAAGLAPDNLRMSVNLSARQFAGAGIVAAVAEAMEEAALGPGSLSLEITESVLMDEVLAMPETLAALKDLGVSLSIDDFGTGYSSLSYLRRFPVDALKVDRSFVRGLGIDVEDSAIVTAIVTLAHALGLSVVAEGVETPAQLEELRRLGCEAVQGYLLGRPEPAHRVERVLATIRSGGLHWPALAADPVSPTASAAIAAQALPSS